MTVNESAVVELIFWVNDYMLWEAFGDQQRSFNILQCCFRRITEYEIREITFLPVHMKTSHQTFRKFNPCKKRTHSLCNINEVTLDQKIR